MEFWGYTWQWELSVPKSRYDQYSSIQVNERFIYGANNFDYLVTTEDPFIRDMAIALRNSSNQMGYSQSDEIGFILAFVQSLPYTSDNITTGYDEFPRFPLETLIDGGGDCEDSSILFATLVIILGYDAIFINPPNHLAVGVMVENVEGSYIEYNNKQYFYCETTISGWSIGVLPDIFDEQDINLILINSNLQCKLEVRSFLIITVVILIILTGLVLVVVWRKRNI
ncbi:MAG: hypothetical protein ACTSYU_10030, partial [Promethearchaeota archaeon]